MAELAVTLRVLILSLVVGVNSQNLLENADFENVFGYKNWFCSSCTIEPDTDALEGVFSGKISGRSLGWHGVNQRIALIPGARYHFVIHMKLLNQKENVLWNEVQLKVTHTTDTGASLYRKISTQPQLRQDQGWQRVGGDFKVPTDVTTSKLFLFVADTELEYLVDSASLTEITFDPDWKNKANQRIDQFRKNNVKINLNLGDNIDPTSVVVQINQTSKSFPFGASVKANRMMDTSPENLKYQQFFYEMFNWGVFGNAMKWKPMEKIQNNVDYCAADYALKRMLDNGISMRGHNMYWGVENHVPDWLRGMSGPPVMLEVYRRAMYSASHFKGKVKHWDVYNEQLHGTFFEEATGKPRYICRILNQVRDFDEEVELFLNDFNVVTTSDLTYAMLKSTYDLKMCGARIDGVGLQSHFQAYPDITLVNNRLDVLSEAGIPLWITELDIVVLNKTRRAQAYDDILTLYYSRPEIEGIVLWGFWNGSHWRPDAALLEGNDLVPNEAGIRFIDLMKNKWMTYRELKPESPKSQLEIRGFHGNYELNILVNGVAVKKDTFTLPKGEDITLNLVL